MQASVLVLYRCKHRCWCYTDVSIGFGVTGTEVCYGRGIDNLRHDVDRLFDSFFGRWSGEGYGTVWVPAIDIEETKDAIVVRAEIPGMTKEEIRIQTVGDKLMISGERKHEAEEKNRHFHRVERAYGKFQRVLQLPVEVQSESATASYKDGVLEITFPKSEKAKTREIEIEVK